jgi:Flp pilus assembly protein TadG
MVRARAERGAAAVEAGLVSTILMPLMVGVLVYGNYFWQPRTSTPMPHGSRPVRSPGRS